MTGISSKLLLRNIILVFFTILTTLIPCHADLTSSLSRHASIRVNQESLRKLKKFDHLIQYFCGFSYFVPNHKVSPEFIKALILAESDANPHAISTKDAIGLGQIIPTTGQEAAKALAKTSRTFRYVKKSQLQNLQRRDLFDPAVNILLTCYLISKYNFKFSGKLDLVVSAWNAGENTHSLQYGNHAPYQETEDLIGKINGYYVYLLNNKTYR